MVLSPALLPYYHLQIKGTAASLESEVCLMGEEAWVSSVVKHPPRFTCVKGRSLSRDVLREFIQ